MSYIARIVVNKSNYIYAQKLLFELGFEWSADGKEIIKPNNIVSIELGHNKQITYSYREHDGVKNIPKIKWTNKEDVRKKIEKYIIINELSI